MLLLGLILKKKEKDKVSSFSFFFFKVCVYSWPLWITNFTKLTLCMHCEGWFNLLQVYFCRAEWLTLQTRGCQRYIFMFQTSLVSLSNGLMWKWRKCKLNFASIVDMIRRSWFYANLCFHNALMQYTSEFSWTVLPFSVLLL